MAVKLLGWLLAVGVAVSSTAGCGGKQKAAAKRVPGKKESGKQEPGKQEPGKQEPGKQEPEKLPSSNIKASKSVAKPIASKDDAIQSFQAQAVALIPQTLHEQVRDFVVSTVKDSEHLTARKKAAKDCFTRIDNSLTPKERETLILHGTLAELKAHQDECWEVMSFGGFGNGIEAYLDAKTGKLILMWIVPEG